MSVLTELTLPLVGHRARLRLAAERDIPEILIAHQDDPQLARQLGLQRPPSGAELGRATETAGARRDEGAGLWLTILAPDDDDDECRGQLDVVVLDAEHGRAGVRQIWVAPRDRGRGLGSAALALVGRELLSRTELERVELLVDPADAALSRAGARAGFSDEGTLRAHVRAGAERADRRVLALVRRDLASSAS